MLDVISVDKEFDKEFENLKFENYTELKKHMSAHKLNNDVFECNQCDKTFSEGWKMNAHSKTHKSYKYLKLMMMHTKISHANFKMY
jgi:hypothetical protein